MKLMIMHVFSLSNATDICEQGNKWKENYDFLINHYTENSSEIGSIKKNNI